MAPDIQPRYIARRTPGYVGGDFEALIREAIFAAVKRLTGERGMGGMEKHE